MSALSTEERERLWQEEEERLKARTELSKNNPDPTTRAINNLSLLVVISWVTWLAFHLMNR